MLAHLFSLLLSRSNLVLVIGIIRACKKVALMFLCFFIKILPYSTILVMHRIFLKFISLGSRVLFSEQLRFKRSACFNGYLCVESTNPVANRESVLHRHMFFFFFMGTFRRMPKTCYANSLFDVIGVMPCCYGGHN